MLGLMLPVSLFLYRIRYVSLVSLHISSGMLPSSEQLLKLNPFNCVSRPMLAGMLPVICGLFRRTSRSNAARSPTSLGMDPRRLFPPP